MPTSPAPDRDPEVAARIGDYHRARGIFPTDAALAAAVPVHPSRIYAWKRGKRPLPEHARILRDLATVASVLGERYPAPMVRRWLRAPDPRFGGRRPLDLVREGGRLPRLLEVAEPQLEVDL